VLPGVYALFALVGFAVALALQAAIIGRTGAPATPVLAGSLVAIIAGFGAAKAWYTMLRPDDSVIHGGWAVDGFIVVMPLVAAVNYHVLDAPVGHVLDALAPGLFLAVGIGRVGCFLTGCCAGRPTSSRWGIWSSDRRVGTRRIPAQLLEAGVGLVLAGATFVVVATLDIPVGGLVFVAGVGVYAAARQGLLRLRAERRRSPRTIPLTAWASAASAMVVAAVAVTHGH
jgi:phosphatidylglycerol:prolipoprotein diacylglycerol transferase